MKHSTEIKVRGFHIDVFGHTNNARYLEFMEVARWELFDELLSNGYFKNQNLGFVVVNINIDYMATSHINQTLLIETELKKIGNKSIVYHQLVKEKESNQPICKADVTFCLLDLKTRKTIVVEGDNLKTIRSLFEPVVS
ncbi:MAG: acyl-CoA thioesterase [Flavobacteriales bacterium]|nr:acyl-CoA thioesterase [Flavobacteriales bacterium]